MGRDTLWWRLPLASNDNPTVRAAYQEYRELKSDNFSLGELCEYLDRRVPYSPTVNRQRDHHRAAANDNYAGRLGPSLRAFVRGLRD